LRPQRQQRRTTRVLNFGLILDLLAFAIKDFFAIS